MRMVIYNEINQMKLGRIVLADTFNATGTGPFLKYLSPASHKERVPVVVSSTNSPAEQLDFSFPEQPLLLLPAPPTFPRVKRLGP